MRGGARSFIPLPTPSGLVLTRDAPDDHPWHHGLWFTIKFVNGENFWEEYDEYGVLRHTGPPDVHATDEAVVVGGGLQWIRPDRESVVIDEARTMTYRPIADDAYVIDFDTTLIPRVDVVLDRTPFTTWGGYGGLTLRGAEQWSDTRILLADDGVAPAGARRSCPLVRSVQRARRHHAARSSRQPALPVPWYGSTQADTYGDGWANFVNAAFLWDEPMVLEADERLRFVTARWCTTTQWDADALDTLHEAFIDMTADNPYADDSPT